MSEIEYTSIAMFSLQKKPVQGDFDFDHLCEIHKRLFQKLYDWAGKPRTVNIGKGNLFCLVQNIPSYADSIFQTYYPQCKSAAGNKEQFVDVLTEHYGDLNALHPFREGNGRTQREFARKVCFTCGYAFDLTHTNHREMLHASILSFQGNNQELKDIFQKAVQPITDYEKHQKRLREAIITLSIDDLSDLEEHDYTPGFSI